MKLVGIKEQIFVKAAHDGLVLLSFYKGEKVIQVHATKIQEGWNSLSLLNDAWKNASHVDATFYKASVPSNIANHLGGSPIIPLSDQDDLKPGVNDVGSQLEPDHESKPKKHRMIRIITSEGKDARDKSEDPFLFSEMSEPDLPKV